MEPRRNIDLRVVSILIIILTTGSSENDLYLNFCGTWRHGKGSLSLSVNLSPGCDGLSISANKTSLSIDGQITAQCRRSDVVSLEQYGLGSQEDSYFCLYWEPLLDQLKLQVAGKNLTLCWPASIRGSCCTDLSHGNNTPYASYGIFNGSVRNDQLSDKIMTAYKFNGEHTDCKKLCDQLNQGSTQVNMVEDPLAPGYVKHPCARSSEVVMKKDFRGFNVTSPAAKGEPAEPLITVHIPPALKQAAKNTSKVAFSFFKNNSLFQDGLEKVKILNDVVEINVENEIIADLPEPIRIGFHHDVVPKTHARECVSWDTRKDPLQVKWSVHGCKTHQHGPNYTECICNHLTYFSVLVQLEPRPVCHLLVLTSITSLGCAVSVISCIALIIFLCKKSKRSKEQSTPIHLGLAISLALLNLLFFFTGVLANVEESVCTWVGAALHYTLLSSFAWMGIEVFHTFWLVYMVFSPFPKPYVWNLLGFVLPAVPVIVLVIIGDIYGVREVQPCDDLHNPYLMCGMTITKHKALLAHYFTNMTILVVLVCSGTVMLFLVYRQIRTRDEWKQNRVAFLSIWGLSCLFGITWGLTFLDFGPFSEFALFLSCILNSFQGFLLMLRFYMLEWIRKQAGGSGLGSTSSGSTRQHMLQEKS
ncbi:G-protein coupled receptor G6 [Collichthys lucidus]|uniref:G-protein coupled receptor G6 n=2 Tax=Sciaenidae TaxID=30870 RepID=A0A4U5U6D6_COLLU|nr:G-protein coupled receptor G6 [Collichthys lucidus]